jgi:Fe-S-cluster containining protein
VVRRARRIVEESADAFPGDARAGLLDPERSEESDDDYFAAVADRACPMLELPSGRCRIYEERPITCRTYGFAWSKDGAVFHPPCGLNFPGAPGERHLATSIDIDRLDQAEDVDGELATELGLEPGRETTIPHAVLGSAFGPPPG